MDEYTNEQVQEIAIYMASKRFRYISLQDQKKFFDPQEQQRHGITTIQIAQATRADWMAAITWMKELGVPVPVNHPYQATHILQTITIVAFDEEIARSKACELFKTTSWNVTIH